MRTPTTLLLTVVATMTLAACGGGSGKSADRSSMAPSRAPSSPPAAAVDPADKAMAEASLLTLSDFPSGWEAKKSDDGDDDQVNHQIADCVGIPYEVIYGDKTAAKADTRDFTNTNDDSISESVTIKTDQSKTEMAFRAFASQKFRDCVAPAFQKEVESEGKKNDLTIGEVTINEVSADKFGDETTALRVTVPVKSDGVSVDLYYDLVAIRVGRAVATIYAYSTVSPFDSDELLGYVKIAAGRLQETLAPNHSPTPEPTLTAAS